VPPKPEAVNEYSYFRRTRISADPASEPSRDRVAA